MVDPHSDPAEVERVAKDVLDSLLEGCQVIDFDWRYRYVNEAAATQGRSTREALLGRTMMECYPGIESSPLGERLRRCMITRRHERMENEFKYPDGSTGIFELRFIPVREGTCILSLDLTDARRTSEALTRSEEQLRQAQKLEAVGRLAGGVAHDFNNMLSVVLGYTSLALSDLPEGAPLRADLEEIRKAGDRAAMLTRRLLAFSRQQLLEPRKLDLNELLREMESMLAPVLGEDISVEFIREPRLMDVFADPNQIEQVLMNLVVNARDAMPHGGKLTVETANVEPDGEFARTHLGVEHRKYVMLAVSDTGIGMDRDTQARIFEPFFTTKGPGTGTGLGLSMVYGSVKQSGGHIWVSSEPGQGSCFKVCLPALADRPEGPDRPTGAGPGCGAAARGGSTRPRGTESILLVEDDDQVRAVARQILETAGYAVLEARGAAEALQLAARISRTIHLLLTDVVMPQMSGVQLARQLASDRPTLRTLCMSGYTNEAGLRHGVAESGLAFLQKPLTPEGLLRKIREVLDSP